MNQAIYELEGVQQWYDGRPILHIEQMSIQSGEILAIVGPSGAGKSTLLRLLNFLERPSQGQLLFDGQETAELPLAQRRRVTMVFQRPILLRRSVASNLQYGLALRGQKLLPEMQASWLERLGLAALARQSAHKLSAGEAQRVALARALLVRPDVLLLDEPTANLDPYNVGLIETLLQEENQRLGMTMVLVTHNIFQARRVAHRVAFLLAGKLVEMAEAETFFNAPAQPETAAFVRGELVY
jgi:tungstate transport system ATP-binding protein